MTRDELVKMIDSGDLQAALLAVGRAWLERYYPEATHATLVARLTDGVPCVVIPVLSQRHAASSSVPLSPLCA